MLQTYIGWEGSAIFFDERLRTGDENLVCQIRYSEIK